MTKSPRIATVLGKFVFMVDFIRYGTKKQITSIVVMILCVAAVPNFIKNRYTGRLICR